MNAPSGSDDKFAGLAEHYDRWIGWGPRLRKEMPFLIEALGQVAAHRPAREPDPSRILDVGCGTGAHAIALASAGLRVTGLDRSAAMLERAREAEGSARRDAALTVEGEPRETLHRDENGSIGDSTDERPAPPPIEWVTGDIAESSVLAGRRFQAVFALGNVLLAVGEEDGVYRALESMVRLVAPGGVLVLQYLNGTRIRSEGRLVLKSSPAGPDGEGEELWLRHHFEAGGRLFFHSYTLRKDAEGWTSEVRTEPVIDLPPERLVLLLESHFGRIEILDGLSPNPWDPARSDAVGIRASARR